MDLRRGGAGLAGKAAVVAGDARDRKLAGRPHDDVFGHRRAGLHRAEGEQLGTDRHGGDHATFDVHRDLRRPRIIGDEEQLPLHVSGGRVGLEPEREVVGGLRRGTGRLREHHLEARVGAADVLDLPWTPPDTRHPHLALGPGPEIDVAQIDERRVERHVAPDVARHPQLHLGVVGLVERDGERRAVLAEEGPGVERRDDLARLVRLEVPLRHHGRRAAAARAHAHDVHVLLVDVLEDEAVLGLRAAGNGAEVVARDREHLLRPLGGRCGRGAQQRDHGPGDDRRVRQAVPRASRAVRAADHHRSAGKEPASGRDSNAGRAARPMRWGGAYGDHVRAVNERGTGGRRMTPTVWSTDAQGDHHRTASISSGQCPGRCGPPLSCENVTRGAATTDTGGRGEVRWTPIPRRWDSWRFRGRIRGAAQGGDGSRGVPGAGLDGQGRRAVPLAGSVRRFGSMVSRGRTGFDRMA